MADSKPVVGIISTSKETRALFNAQLLAARFDCFTVEVDRYPTNPDESQAKQLLELKPVIVIVEMQNRETTLATLALIHGALPETWLFVSAPENDPQLIIETMHAGAREFLPRPSTPEKLAQALERYSTVRQKATAAVKGKVFCLTSAKGGAGTTSVAVNLAAATAGYAGEKVALVDLGVPVGDVAEYLNLKSRYTIADAINSTTRLDAVLLESFMSTKYGVAVLPGSREFHAGLFSYDILSKMFQVMAETYTHTFLDMSCVHDEEQLRAATEFCDTILVILTPELPALWRTDRLIRLFDKNGARNKLRLVINRADKKHEIGTKEIEKALEYSIFHGLPNDYPEAIAAVNSGKPLVLSRKSKLAESYLKLGSALTGLQPAQKKRGFFCL